MKRAKYRTPGSVVDSLLSEAFVDFYQKRRKYRKMFRMLERKLNKGVM